MSVPVGMIIDNLGFSFAFLLCQCLTLCYHICLMVHSLKVQYISLVLAVCARITYVGTMFIYLGSVFSFESNYGRLVGTLLLIKGLVGALLEPLHTYVMKKQDGDFDGVNKVFLIAASVLILFPLKVYLDEQAEEDDMVVIPQHMSDSQSMLPPRGSSMPVNMPQYGAADDPMSSPIGSLLAQKSFDKVPISPNRLLRGNTPPRVSLRETLRTSPPRCEAIPYQDQMCEAIPYQDQTGSFGRRSKFWTLSGNDPDRTV